MTGQFHRLSWVKSGHPTIRVNTSYLDDYRPIVLKTQQRLPNRNTSSAADRLVLAGWRNRWWGGLFILGRPPDVHGLLEGVWQWCSQGLRTRQRERSSHHGHQSYQQHRRNPLRVLHRPRIRELEKSNNSAHLLQSVWHQGVEYIRGSLLEHSTSGSRIYQCPSTRPLRSNLEARRVLYQLANVT